MFVILLKLSQKRHKEHKYYCVIFIITITVLLVALLNRCLQNTGLVDITTYQECYKIALQENLVTVSKYHTAILRPLTLLRSTTLLYKEFVVL